MGRFLDWVRAEAAATLRPEFDAVREEMQRSMHDLSDGLRQQIAREHEQTRRQTVVLQTELADRTRSLVDALDQTRAQLDAHRAAQQGQLQALDGSMRDLMIAIGPATRARPTIVAGSIQPATAHSGGEGNEIDLTDGFGPGAPVEARSRFTDAWFEGLEIAETVEEAEGARYRVARRRDGRMLPMLFDAADLRPAAVASSESQTG